MRSWAVIADCHGNSLALRAVLDDIDRRGISDVVNLGDSADANLDPAGVVSLLMERDITSLAGNYETYREGELSPEQVTWLQTRPKTLDLGDIFCCHGTPVSDHEELIEDITLPFVGLASAATIQSRLHGVGHPVVLCAHKHVPRLVRLPSGQLIINPGSVGWPAYWNDEPSLHLVEAGSPHARYAILRDTDAGWVVEHIALPYDWDAAATLATSKGNAERADAIRTGRVLLPDRQHGSGTD